LDKHVVLFVSEKYYVTFYKLPRWIMDYWAMRKLDEEKMCTRSVEESQTHILLGWQEGE
jgi:hypothetical protein